jgi:hypothetical protein
MRGREEHHRCGKDDGGSSGKLGNGSADEFPTMAKHG